MFNLTDQDIVALDASDLRRLVAWLVEATARARGISTAGIRAGGADTTADAGLDVVAEFDGPFQPGGWLLRPVIGYQVKKHAMGPAAIKKEMCPSGSLRPAIVELRDKAGAYVIVTSGESLTEAPNQRKARLNAMTAASGPETGLLVDVLDRGRLVTWVNDFPSVALWVRELAGRGTDGWRPYGTWSRAATNGERRYIADETARFDIAESGADGGRSRDVAVVEGIARLRDRLRCGGSAVRLIGLSGMGKTRLAEALFETEVGTNPLPREWPIYADAGSTLSPSPAEMVRRLGASGTRAVVVVDNCSPQEHRDLAIACRGLARVSVLTIEYDVREDLPEETHVFRLRAASGDTVKSIVAAHHPHVSEVDQRTIASYSGGNARIALVLAGTIRMGESLAGVRDSDLLRRLVVQRNPEDDHLMRTVCACALLYSFNASDPSHPDSEIPLLAAVAEQSTTTFVRNVRTLLERELIQSRGVWRAVLPQAIAKQLAGRALAEMPTSEIELRLAVRDRIRGWTSFARRLGMLHDSAEARQIAFDWLEPGGPLSDVGALNREGRAVLRGIAPTDPDLTLRAIEAADRRGKITDSGSVELRRFLASILRRIAYDPVLFDRGAAVLARIAVLDQPSKNADDVRAVLASLFSPHLSGTLAPPDLRAKFLRSMLASNDLASRQLGADGLRAWLNTGPYTSSRGFEFGAWSRTYGYSPGTAQQKEEWFSLGIDMALDFASARPESDQRLLADAMRDLWRCGVAKPAIIRAARSIAARGFWAAGWVALRAALSAMRRRPEAGKTEELEMLVSELAPRSLADRIKVHVLEELPWNFEEDEDALPARYSALEQSRMEYAEALGREVAGELKVLDDLLPALVTRHGRRIGNFTIGLARAATAPDAIWECLVRHAMRDPDQAQQQALGGFLLGWQEREAAAVRSALDALLTCQPLVRLVPWLHAWITPDSTTPDRLRQAIRSGGAQAHGFGWLASARSISASDVVEVLEEIMRVPGGTRAALEILVGRLTPGIGDDPDPEPLRGLGRKMLCDVSILETVDPNMGDYYIGQIVDKCLQGADGTQAAVNFCRTIAAAEEHYSVVMHLRNSTLSSLFKAYPHIALEELLPRTDGRSYLPDALVGRDEDDQRESPLRDITEEVLLAWCSQSPEENYDRAASCVPFRVEQQAGQPIAWHPLAAALLRHAPDPSRILRRFADRFDPMGGWGEQTASVIESNGQLLDSLPVPMLPPLLQVVAEAKLEVQAAAQRWRAWAQRDREADRGFE